MIDVKTTPTITMNNKPRLAEIPSTGYNQGMDYPVVLERCNEGGWTARCPVLPGCISEGDTRDKALANIQDAIRLYLRAVRKEMTILRQKGKRIVSIAA